MAEEKNTFRTTIGGQALIEGILMRGPDKQAIVVRSKEGLVTKVEERKFTKDNYPILGIPLIRGSIVFLGSMIQGVKALMYSADFFPEDENAQPDKLDQWIEKHIPGEKQQTVIITTTVIISIAMTLFLFLFLPTFLAGLVDPFINSAVVHNVIEGIVKISIFMIYLIVCSKQKDVRRVFCYHGAEHKTIFCYEAGLPLTVENVRKQPKHHPRCGTSFLFIVIVVSILASCVASAFINWRVLWVRLAMHLLLLIPIVGVTYEFNRLVGAHDNALTRFLSAPGMWMQNFTTNEPDDSMIEVAIEAMKLVIPEEKGKDNW